jgi:hypothetical protein
MWAFPAPLAIVPSNGLLGSNCCNQAITPTENYGEIAILQQKANNIYGHVKWAAPKILSCDPPSGFIDEDPAPARIVAVPVNPGTHCANPFWSTVTPGFMFPTHMPLFDPVHHVTSLFVSCTGDGGLLKAPVAVNGTWPLGKFRASANAGFSVTDCNWRLLPHPTIPSAMMGGRRKRRQQPKWGMATSIHNSRIL